MERTWLIVSKEKKQILIDVKELDRFFVRENMEWLATEPRTEEFDGTIFYRYGELVKEEQITRRMMTIF